LTSRERAEALKRDKYTCQVCGKKQSMAKGRVHKVSVHHIHDLRGHLDKEIPDWTGYINALFCSPNGLKTVCNPKFGNCHKLEHDKMKIEAKGGTRLREFNR